MVSEALGVEYGPDSEQQSGITEELDFADLIARLRQNAVFAPCGAELLEKVVHRASLYVASRGTRVAQADVFFPFIGFVSKGNLAITLQTEGPIRGVHRLHIYEAVTGAIFGEIAFLAASPPPGDVVVISKSATYALFPSDSIEEALTADPSLLRRLANQLAQRTYDLAQRVTAAQGGWPASARVASVLLRFANQGEGLVAAKTELAEITQVDIAAAAGCAKESAARAISYLQSVGALRREHGHIRHLNRHLLERYAGGAPTT